MNPDFPKNQVRNTRYTLLTFIPINLWEQFHSFWNIYFLILACMQLFRVISPTSPILIWTPLLIVLSITAIKDAFEDYRRYRQDKAANSRLVAIVGPDAQRCSLASGDMVVGQLFYLEPGEEVPADAIILRASSPDGVLHVHTANIDGESQPRPRLSVYPHSPLVCGELESYFDCELLVDSPSQDLEHFHGVLRKDGAQVALGLDNTLWQGMQLTTGRALCVAIYTGPDTRLARNKRIARAKRTTFDRRTNIWTMSLFGFQWAISIAFSVAYAVISPSKLPWYLDVNPFPGTLEKVVIVPLRFFILSSMCVPISFRVTVDVMRLGMAWLVQRDPAMDATVRNSSSLEEIGLVNWVLTDKTGTLTANELRLAGLSTTHSRMTARALGQLAAEYVQRGDIAPTEAEAAALVVSLCNQCTPCDRLTAPSSPAEEELLDSREVDVSPVEALKSALPVSYESLSIDEQVLCTSMAQSGRCGIVSRGNGLIRLSACGHEAEFVELAVLSFSSERKRMGILLARVTPAMHAEAQAQNEPLAVYAQRQARAGAIEGLLLCKGAGEVLSLCCNEVDADLTRQLDTYADRGLRTLLFAYRVMDAPTLARTLDLIHQASVSRTNRELMLAAAYSVAEAQLTACGASALEDRLQDGVPETIDALRAAHIHVAMLTGDAMRTACVIATNCGIIKQGDHIVRVTEPSGLPLPGALEPNSVLVLEGTTLGGILDASGPEFFADCDPFGIRDDGLPPESDPLFSHGRIAPTCARHPPLVRRLLRCCCNCRAVVFCRLAPAHKAEIVSLLGTLPRSPVTLMVGDGGNDTAAIQAAHVGVGIAGAEGQQAARASDVSIGQFRELQQLLFVHGRACTRRISFALQYSMYKSTIVGVSQVFYNIFTGASGQGLMSKIAQALYNTLYTCPPAILYAIDEDIPRTEALDNPGRHTENRKEFTPVSIAQWSARALWQVFVLLLFCALCDGAGGISPRGHELGYITQSLVTTTVILLVQFFTLISYWHTWHWSAPVIIVGCQLSYYATLLGCSFIPGNEILLSLELLRTPWFWVVTIALTALCLLPGLVCRGTAVLARHAKETRSLCDISLP